mgnify:FL=1
MHFPHHCGAFCATTALLWCVNTHAHQHESSAIPEDRYDLRRLMQPSAAELASEKKGRIHIYDSLEINEINSALDENFDRIQNMMFTRIYHLPPPGAGPDDEVEIEDDGCD